MTGPNSFWLWSEKGTSDPHQGHVQIRRLQQRILDWASIQNKIKISRKVSSRVAFPSNTASSNMDTAERRRNVYSLQDMIETRSLLLFVQADLMDGTCQARVATFLIWFVLHWLLFGLWCLNGEYISHDTWDVFFSFFRRIWKSDSITTRVIIWRVCRMFYILRGNVEIK